MKDKATEFIGKCYREFGREVEISSRLNEVMSQIDLKGTYDHTYEELEHGAKMAWRNSNKCIGRLFWETLTVKDARHITSANDIFQTLEDHITKATNKGKIKPTITIFKPREKNNNVMRILNHQLIRYAGYESVNGIIGDPHSIAFTKLCESLGWKGKRSNFDLLPLVIKVSDGTMEWRDLKTEAIIEVPITHPEEPQIQELNLQWYAVPIISDMLLEIGGIEYPTAPFNGWYMGTEIGARNLADKERYDLLPLVANKLNLDTSRASSLWKDRALVELNHAVLYSFQKNGVSIVDHHTAAEQFKLFEKREAVKERSVTGHWSWLIPPVSPATTHIFHHEYEDTIISPNFHYQENVYDTE